MSSFVDATSKSVEHCEAMSQQFPDLAEPYYNKMAEYCQQKLWHQLTLCVLDFLTKASKTTLRATSDASQKNTHLALYQKVVLAVVPKLNALALARIASLVAVSSLQQGGTVEESKTLLEELLAKLKEEDGESDAAAATAADSSPNSVPTALFLQSKIALLTLTQPTTPPTAADLVSIYSVIKANSPLLNQVMSDTPEAIIVHSSHYEMSMLYYKLVGPPEAYYDEAMHYLNYYQPGPDDGPKSHALAVDLCLAALTGEGVYNLGQVVTNPILRVLRDTPDGWLVELLQACSKGSVSEFHKLRKETYPTQLAAQPALVNMSQQMQEKMTLLALVEMVFERPASERTLTFADIAQRLQISIDQVEWVIMRAFSVKLMEGCMDQVVEGHGQVHVTWVLPRVLDGVQMADLATRFGEWATKVGTVQEYMHENATLAA
jgi:26S proteasome regulatory subunit N9